MGDKKKITIAVMMRDISNSFNEAMYAGFRYGAREENINLFFLMGPQSSSGRDEELLDDQNADYSVSMDSVFDYVHVVKPDALILVGGSLSKSEILPDVDALIERYKDIKCLVLENVPTHPSISYQIADNYQAMCDCMEHLIGHHRYKNIVYVSGDPSLHDFQERLNAYKDCMNNNFLDIEEGQIVICDDSSLVERKINCIFDDFPYVEAIVCCSDYYAHIVYDVCRLRGLRVGKDIAVTGFDDLLVSRSKNPPLTSVTHDSFKFGYNAIKRGIKIAQGHYLGESKTPCYFVKRSSCGCNYSINIDEYVYSNDYLNEQDNVKDYIKKTVPNVVDDIYTMFPYEMEKKAFLSVYGDMFSYVYHLLFNEWGDSSNVNDKLSKFVVRLAEFDNISIRVVTIETISVLEKIMHFLASEKPRTKLNFIMLELTGRLMEVENYSLKRINERINSQINFITTFTKDLIDPNIGYADAVSIMLKRLKGMNIKEAHLFLFMKPVVCKQNTLPDVPKELYHAGYFNDTDLRVYLPQNGIILDWDNGISSLFPEHEHHLFSTFVLCSGNEYYGIVMYECDRHDVFFTMNCSIQIGLFLYYRELIKDRDRLLNTIEEKNEIIQELKNDNTESDEK